MSGKNNSLAPAGSRYARLTVKVQPRSPTNAIAGILPDGTIKIKLTAPPVEGKANEALVDLLARILEVNKTDIDIRTGHSARLKTVRINNSAQESVDIKIQKSIRD